MSTPADAPALLTPAEEEQPLSRKELEAIAEPGGNPVLRTYPAARAARTALRLLEERDEADRRAGAAERQLAHLEDSAIRRDSWLRHAKEEAGYHENVSFDTVWAEVLEKARRAGVYAAEVVEFREENARLRSALDDCAEGLEDAIAYVSPYFREKWGHDEYLARARAALAASPAGDAPQAAPASTLPHDKGAVSLPMEAPADE